MIAMMFEVRPRPGRREAYLDRAAALRPLVEQIDGFISIERFQSLSDPEKLLSLGFFRDEAALTAWLTHATHRSAQTAGREGIFEDYRLRVAAVVRDYGMHDRTQAPVDSRCHHREAEVQREPGG